MSPTVVSDDIEAIQILIEHGLLDQCQIKPGCNQAHVFFEHEDQWCIGVNCIGHANPTDNGYAVIQIPKSEATKEEASELFLAHAIGCDLGGFMFLSDYEATVHRNQ